MATHPDFVAFVCEQVDLGARVTYRKMFGEYALYLDGKVVAFACDNHLYLKPTAAGRALLAQPDEHPPYPGGKPHFRLGDALDDRALMRRLLLVTADALPAPTPKRVRRAAPKG
ncbi:MAG TPA: TfoX/Sxy family protein [Macromonas sp.]|nr:TfoX/Sxy family protein [Macromonas sp.]